jgi:hypothetical protein
MSDVVAVPFTTQLLALAVALQAVAFVAVLWRGFFGLAQLSTRRPRWPFIPLIIGTGAGVWYAVIQRDLLMGVAQALALFIGFCLINSTRGEQRQSPQGATRKERREAGREMKRQQKRAKRGGADGAS